MYEIDASISKLEINLSRTERCMHAKPGKEDIDRILAIIEHRSHCWPYRSSTWLLQLPNLCIWLYGMVLASCRMPRC
jgi:hypothetical protein